MYSGPRKSACVVDVRSIPRSRTNPQYNFDLFPRSLLEFQIEYVHIAELGGRRGRQRDIAPRLNGYWENQSFHNYADYALSPEFGSGLNQLRNLGHQKQCVIMCAEAVWWRCHRRIIADYLLTAGESVFHILGKDRIEEARLTSAAIDFDLTLLSYTPQMPENKRRLRQSRS